jgi:FHA domain-containing protein
VAVLLNRCTKERRQLQSHTLVGRAQPCGLRIDEPVVSGEHAALSWQDGAWHVRDLGSRNGTFLNGARLEMAVAYRCEAGAVLAFGDARVEWELLDASEPCPMALPLRGGDPCLIAHGIISIPDSDHPLASIHEGAGGGWLLELEDRVDEIVDGSLIQVGGESWRFHRPQVWSSTETPRQRPLVLESTQLVFRVSSDEESVELDLRCEGRVVPLGSRSAFYLLLTLARIRIAQRGTPGAGWVHWTELARLMHTEQSEINVWVHRIRERFADAGVLRPGAIIERRHRVGQLRIGVDDITISAM